jgi:nucleoside-diphosphate-sugar epimerase
MNFWNEKEILVAGDAGFLGSFVVDGLIMKKKKRSPREHQNSKECKHGFENMGELRQCCQ